MVLKRTNTIYKEEKMTQMKRVMMGFLIPEEEREKQKINFKQWYQKNKEKHIANCKENNKKCKKHQIRVRTNNHRKDIIKLLGSKCRKCNSNENIEIHHLNYNIPDKVEILCRDCHRRDHRLFQIK